MDKKYDFSGWATKNDIECSDGRVIMRDAFRHNNGDKVPLVWNHQHNTQDNVLGHAYLENRKDGVYAYCKFNNTNAGETARELVKNGDVDKLSIYANKLKSQQNKVVHGVIREVSLVLAGANPGAFIDSVMVHAEDGSEEEEGFIYTEESIELDKTKKKKEDPEWIDSKEDDSKEDDKNNNPEEDPKMKNDNNMKHADEEMTVQEIFETLDDQQKEAVYAIVGQAVEDATGGEDDQSNEGDDNMKHNVFDSYEDTMETVLTHNAFKEDVIKDWKKQGSMRESFLFHADEYGFDPDLGFTPLFPDAQMINQEPQMIEKDNSWVADVMSSVKHSPFSRVKASYGKLKEPEARAKGYIKGTKKVDSKIAFLNRVTTPTTVYIKSEIDRDDIVDITSFDVIAWQKKELRKQLDKELALAMLVGDGRSEADDHKINEQNIRPILSDDDMYTIKYKIREGVDFKQPTNSSSDNDSVSKGIIRGALRARKEYKGSGSPTFYTTEDVLTDLLLIEDQNGRAIYESVEKLATTLRVKKIVTVPEMEADNYKNVYGLIVNLNDYTAGADQGGSINMFDDFDIDYNQMKYLMETRMSGALTVPFSAIALLKDVTPESAGTNTSGE